MENEPPKQPIKKTGKRGRPKGYSPLGKPNQDGLVYIKNKKLLAERENPYQMPPLSANKLTIPVEIKTLGSHNGVKGPKLPQDMVQTVLDVFNFLGGEVFMAEWAKENPNLFMTHMVAKLLPKDVNLKKTTTVTGEVTITQQFLQKLTMEQLHELESLTIEHQPQEQPCQPQTDMMQPSSPTVADTTMDSPGSQLESEIELSEIISE